jgi:hypothetical protein
MKTETLELTPETIAEFEQLIDQSDEAQLSAIEQALLSEIVKDSDSPESFGAFYRMVHGNVLPPHMVKTIEHIYAAKNEDKGSLMFEWRGSWKTTTISITFVAYRMGKDPNRSNLVIQANDDSANKVTLQITSLIANHPAWKLCFPNVVPDENRGWGEGGYWVIDTNLSAGEWAKLTADRKDPSLLGLGIRSRSLIGKHPDGVLLMDDIHDEENTASDRENQNVINKVTGTILPFIVEDWEQDEGERLITWPIVVGTPWRDDDAYHHLKNTGEFKFLKIPAAVEYAEEEEGTVWIEDKDTGLAGWFKMTWPERFTPELMITWRRRVGKREFARMYLLDLDASKITGLKFSSFPAERVNIVEWATSAGVDFASIRYRDSDTKNRDYFAIAYIAKIPTGGAVIFGGQFGHYTQIQAEETIERIQNTLPKFSHTVVEDDGKGEAFVDILMRKPHLKVTPMLTRGRGKKLRQEKEMAPWFEVGIIRISDEDSPFLNLVRRSFSDYPDGNDDVRDAVYWACRSIPEVLRIPDASESLPRYVLEQNKKQNPFNSLGG